MTDLMTVDAKWIELKRTALTAIVELSTLHGLPMPMSVYLQNLVYPLIDIRLDNNSRHGVLRWADALDLKIEEQLHPGDPTFLSFRATRASHDIPQWLGFHDITVWSACDLDDTAGRDPVAK